MKKDRIKVSVIVPVYNAEKYLDRSILSLINQELEEIEIILINDGSEDNSLKICEQYAKRDSRIIVVNQINRGVSSARNMGINIARGECIAFIDADDYVEYDMYKNMYDKMNRTKSEMCICSYLRESKEEKKKINHNIKSEIISKEEIYKQVIPNIIAPNSIISSNSLIGFRSACVYLYNTKLIRMNKINFRENLPIGEDFLFNLYTLSKTSRLCTENKNYYHYCYNKESAMNSYRKNWWDIHKILVSEIQVFLRQLYKNKAINQNIEKRLDLLKINYFLLAIDNECNEDNKKTYANKIRYIKNVYKDPILKCSLKGYKEQFKFNKKIILLCLVRMKSIHIIYTYYNFKKNRGKR